MDDDAGERTVPSDARITAAYQAACLVLATYAEFEQVRASYASPPSQWPRDEQVSGWPPEASGAYYAAMGRYRTALDGLVRMVPESFAPLHFAHGSRKLLRVAYEDVEGDPRGGKFITVQVYPLIIPDEVENS